MRNRFFQVAALWLGLIGIPCVVLQAWQMWPLAVWQIYFFALEGVVLYAFVAYGLCFYSDVPRRQLRNDSDPGPGTTNEP